MHIDEWLERVEKQADRYANEEEDSSWHGKLLLLRDTARDILEEINDVWGSRS